MRGTGWIAVALVLLNHRPAQSQTQQLEVSRVDNQQGVVFLYAENHAFVPYTVFLKPRLVNMRCPDAMPLRTVVFPSKQPQLLTTFTYTPGQVHSYEYDSWAQMGIYSSRPADTTYAYRYPSEQVHTFRPTKWLPPPRSEAAASYNYLFDLPGGSPVLAARSGIVVAFRDDVRRNTRAAYNFIMVFHEDGSYANYANIAPSGVGVTVGQYVSAGQRIATSDRRRKPVPLVFLVGYPGEAAPVQLPVHFAPENQAPARP